jgi:hypothetical protein
MTALQEPPAPRSWARPTKTRRQARSRTAPVAPRAASWLQPLPNRLTLGWALAQPAERNPTKARAQLLLALPRRVAIPRSAQAAVVRQLAVVAALEWQAEVPAPSARRAEAHPRPAQAAPVSHPSWVRQAAEPAALRQVREAGVVASKVAAEAARPTSARRAGWVQVWALPRWARQAEAVGPRRLAVAAALPARPRLPGPTSPARRPAGPSWARLPEEPRQLGRQGSARARPRAAPRWLRSLPGETPPLSAAAMPGGRAARSFLAGGAYV